jgi:hypothetical protein
MGAGRSAAVGGEGRVGIGAVPIKENRKTQKGTGTGSFGVSVRIRQGDQL